MAGRVPALPAGCCIQAAGGQISNRPALSGNGLRPRRGAANVRAGQPLPNRFAMRTYTDLYPRVCSFENLYLAYRAARRGKRGAQAVATFEYDQERQLVDLRAQLLAGAWRPGPYTSFYVHDPKRRLISAAPFRDRVVHHALINVIEPIWERRFIHDTYANRLHKGTHRALDRCQQFARRWPYVLQCDIRQYFPAIDHALLFDELARLLRDEAVLELCGRILASGVGVLAEAYDMHWFPGDDLWAATRPRGLPIGNLTSQFWANVFLSRFDHFVKRDLKCEGYVRYVDDLLLFGDDRQRLRDWRAAVIEQLGWLRLGLHTQSAQAFPVAAGIPFLGFRVFPTHRRLKRRNGVKFERRLRVLARRYARGELPADRVAEAVTGWVNHARYGDTWGLRRAILGRRRLPRPGAAARVIH